MIRLKKVISLTLALIIILPVFFVLTSCGQGTVTLRILHWADYMDEDLLDEFERDYTTGGYKQPGQKIDIIFEAVANPEIMAVKIEKGKEPWDIMCPSETVLERLLKQNLLKPIDMENLPNYNDFVSPAMKEKSLNVEESAKEAIKKMKDADLKKYNEYGFNEWNDEAFKAQYSVGYMWGNFGILYNTEKMAGKEGLLNGWDALWNAEFKDDIMMKNTPRESFAIAVIYIYRNELKELYDIYLDTNDEHDLKNYKNFLAEALSISDKFLDETMLTEEDTAKVTLTPSDTNTKLEPKTYTLYKGLKLIAKVEEALKTQREISNPVYETDDGKEQMVNGRYAMDMAWNGDAIWSMSDADEGLLDFIVPKEGSNFWIDSWVIPKYSENQEIAEMFLNFLCDPDSSVRNMEYVGYTSVNSSEDILKWAVLNGGNFDNPIDVSYFFCTEDSDNPGEYLPMSKITLTDDLEIWYKGDIPAFRVGNKLYNIETHALIAELVVDEDGEIQDAKEFELSEDETLYIEEVWYDYDEINNSFETFAYRIGDKLYNRETGDLITEDCENNAKGFQLFEINVKNAFVSDIQYPSQAEYDRCGVMLGYSDYNDEILEMWTRVKGAALPLYVIIGLSLILSGAVFLGIFFSVRKSMYNKKIKGAAKSQSNIKN